MDTLIRYQTLISTIAIGRKLCSTCMKAHAVGESLAKYYTISICQCACLSPILLHTHHGLCYWLFVASDLLSGQRPTTRLHWYCLLNYILLRRAFSTIRDVYMILRIISQLLIRGCSVFISIGEYPTDNQRRGLEYSISNNIPLTRTYISYRL